MKKKYRRLANDTLRRDFEEQRALLQSSMGNFVCKLPRRLLTNRRRSKKTTRSMTRSRGTGCGAVRVLTELIGKGIAPPALQRHARLEICMSDDPKLNEWNLLREKFDAVVDEGARQDNLEQVLDEHIRRRFGELIAWAADTKLRVIAALAPRPISRQWVADLRTSSGTLVRVPRVPRPKISHRLFAARRVAVIIHRGRLLPRGYRPKTTAAPSVRAADGRCGQSLARSRHQAAHRSRRCPNNPHCCLKILCASVRVSAASRRSRSASLCSTWAGSTRLRSNLPKLAAPLLRDLGDIGSDSWSIKKSFEEVRQLSDRRRWRPSASAAR